MKQRRFLRADLNHLRDQAIDTAVAESRTRAARAERDTPCPKCPRILRGEQGLRHHLLQRHGETE